MNLIRRILATNFWADEEGAASSEYALLISFIAMAILMAVTAFGNTVNNLFASANTTLGS